jgi:DDE superfamily endonuclease
MNAPASILPLLLAFVHCFTAPGFRHFTHFILAHMALLGVPHCVTETLRLTQVHHVRHWTTPYAFLRRGRWSCQQVSQSLLDVLGKKLPLGGEVVVAVDDTLVKKWGRKFFGLGLYPDPTDKNPGASKRRVYGHCWVVLALLWEYRGGKWLGFPLAALLFVPRRRCSAVWPFLSKIDLAERLLRGLRWPAGRVIMVVDNLYAKAQLARLVVNHQRCILVSRLRTNAALYLPPRPCRRPRRGRPQVRGPKLTARQLYGRRSQRRRLSVGIYGKRVAVEAYVGVVIPSRRLGNAGLRVVIFPQRSGPKMNIFFTTELTMAPERVLELYAARFKIEDCFDEVKTVGGFADCRQRSFPALKRHATLCLLAYSLLRLLSVTLPGAQTIETEPWWCPAGPPSVTRLRRAAFKALRISPRLHTEPEVNENPSFKEAA